MLSQKSGYYHRLIFKAVVLFTQVACCAPYVRDIMAPYQKIFLAWGALIILLELARGYRPWKQRDTVLFGIFLGTYLISVFAAGSQYMSENLRACLYMIMMFVLFYAVDVGDRAQRVKENAILLNVILFSIVALTITALVISVTIKRGRRFKLPSGGVMYIGFGGTRLAGITNANIGGGLYAIAIIIALKNMMKPGRLRAPRVAMYVLIILLEGATLILAYSRTSIYALIAVVTFAVFWQLPNRIKKLENCRAAGRLFARFAAALLVAAALIISINPLRSALITDMKAIRKWYKSLSSVQTVSAIDDVRLYAAAANEDEDGEEEEDISLNDMMSNRLAIWADSGRLLFKHPLLGISNEAIKDALSEGKRFAVWHAHSIYVTVPLASGIAGAAALTLFSVNGLRAVLKRRKELWKSSDNYTVGIVLLLIFMLIRELTETTVLFRFTFFACFLWLLLGGLRQEVEAGRPCALQEEKKEQHSL